MGKLICRQSASSSYTNKRSLRSLWPRLGLSIYPEALTSSGENVELTLRKKSWEIEKQKKKNKIEGLEMYLLTFNILSNAFSFSLFQVIRSNCKIKWRLIKGNHFNFNRTLSPALFLRFLFHPRTCDLKQVFTNFSSDEQSEKNKKKLF